MNNLPDNTHHQLRFTKLLRTLSGTASSIVVLLSAIVILGWILDIGFLKSVFPGLPKMTANTALGLGLSGISLSLLQKEQANQWAHHIARILAFLVVLAALLTLSQYLFGWNLGIDQLIFKDPAKGSTYPGRPSPQTAVTFVLAGCALFFLAMETRRFNRLAQILTLIALMIPLIALIGYLYQVTVFYGITPSTGMAVHTVLGFLLICLGMLARFPTEGVMRILTSQYVGSQIARRLLLAAVVVPLVLGWLSLKGQQAGLFTPSLGASLLALSNMIVFTVLILTTAQSLNLADIQRQRAEGALRKHREQLEELVAERTAALTQAVERLRLQGAALDSAANAIVITDRKGAMIWVNPAFTSLTGYAKEEAIGNNPRMLKSGKQEDTFYRDLWDTILTGKVWQGEVVNRRKDNTLYFEEMTITPVHDERGEISHFIAIKLDITGRKQAEETLANYADRLAQSNRDLEEFAYVASHDLQEPLKKVLSFSDRILNRYADQLDETGMDYLRRMGAATQRMQKLISDLLDFSRVTTRGKPFEIVSLDEIVGQVLQDLDHRILETKATVKVETMINIEADPTQIYRLFLNLVNNSLKYHQSEGIPEISIYCEGMNSSDGEGSCKIFVKDNGIGFDTRYLDRIFKPFQRLHGREEYEGSGMGLAICRRIVERHGGSITANSAPGQGATFLVTLPLHQSEGDK